MKEQNYKKGDIFPENKKIREHFFNLGERGEHYWDTTIGSNENVEIKTQDLNNTLQYGNLFIEHSALYAGKTEIKPSGISITNCDTWIFQFVDEKGKHYPLSINIQKEYLLERIEQGLKLGIVRDIPTNNLATGDINYGYLLSILFLFEPLIFNTHKLPKDAFCNKVKKEFTENERNNRLAEIHNNKRNK
jgi:hypothetical protein